ncbi:hypothetical protein RclHR1_06030002 [Rhizophagus clarus]|uniref:Uncharacterized protein n=1 Tax=Rhizophagus clarus TaxID=94130 RepID=A0A2Z6S8H7_9GLOM|nr:hypothetical protein RclHR1_06030002 [Rhizophagus clarus]GES83296.1 hypothetical protein RCL_jg16004.t1 [Rhizophagus clarus]
MVAACKMADTGVGFPRKPEYFYLFPAFLGISFGVLLELLAISPNISIYWIDAGLLCSELHLKISAQRNV